MRGAAGELAAAAHEPDRRRRPRAARGAPAARRNAGGDLQHAAPADGPRRPRARAPDRSRRARQRASGVRGIQARRHADARGRRIRRQAGRRGVGARARRDAEGRVPRVSEAPARQGRGGCAAGRARRHAARADVSEADAMGRPARGRPRRAAVWPAHPLDSVRVRRPCRAVHDRAVAGGADRAGPGRDGRRGDLRPSLPDDERARGARDQGPHLRRLPRAAARELRHPRAQRAPQQDCARAGREGAAAEGPGQPRRPQRVGAAARGARSGRVPSRSSPARSRRSSPTRCPKKC